MDDSRLLTDARRAARVGPDGLLIPLTEQDRTLWSRSAIQEGTALVTDALTLLNRKRVIEFAAEHRIPAMYEFSGLVRDGGLMSYGASSAANCRRSADLDIRCLEGSPKAQFKNSWAGSPR